ncbi:MAG: type II toxin-antitoxin system Phd/YefM family antitoxin [Solirubrobacteraceae bacterium]
MTEVGMHEAKTKLSQLVDRAERGEEIVITRNGKPAVKLAPIASAASLAAVRGAWRGQVELAADFDELPDDIAEAFGAK